VQSRVIRILVIVNLTILAIILIGKIHIIKLLITTIAKAFLIPLIISVLIYYIVTPLNNIFINKGMKRGKASLLTLSIFIFILSGFLSYFGKYAYGEFAQITKNIWIIISDRKQIDGSINWINNYININEIYNLLLGMVENYIKQISSSLMKIVGYFINTFSIVFLIIVIVYYMLRDGDKFKTKVISFIPTKYKEISDKILSESNVILSHYVTGQAKVALSLAVMIFLGYVIIKMPDALLLSTVTFILAFIPFVGFFISMIIPTVIALGMGWYMFFKLVAVFVIVQTLKGRVVVPAIMAKSMNIHPLTDIFLVILSIAVGGPFAAFAVVPVYAIIKNIFVSWHHEKK
jgi:predicted PurR-regulated permease PerM